MNTEDRIIKKMIDNIVERNKPEFEPKTAPAVAQNNVSAKPVEDPTIARKIEYGFNSVRSDNAEMRKSLDELKGMLSVMRNDLDSLRMAVQQSARASHPAAERHVEQASPAAGAPQYRKTAADEAWENKNSDESSAEGTPKVQQARGFQKKDDTAQVDISKVFYYGKK